MKFTVITTTAFFIPCILFAQNNADFSTKLPQSQIITSIMQKEKSTERIKQLTELIDSIDGTYSNLYEQRLSGKKIRIFMDPAHGKIMFNGAPEWEGAVTWRKSSTGLPEELYSIPIARKIYKRFTENGNFEVITTPDYLEVLQGKSDSYKNITFDDAVNMAKESGCFIIIAEHLNNISPIVKADGFVNIRGVHITCNEQRTPFLSYVPGVNRGYYTLFSLYDPTGTSRLIGEGFREKMLAMGHDPNGWENGNVGDDRFSLYINFPVSVIYESGFISNPDEEKLLCDETYQDTIVDAQYDGIIASIKTKFGVDLASATPEKTAQENTQIIDLIKLTRIMVFYTQKGDFQKAISAIKIIENTYQSTAFKNNILPLSRLKDRLALLDNHIKIANNFVKKGIYAKGAARYQHAIKTMSYHPLFNEIRENTFSQYNVCARKIGKKEMRYFYNLAHSDVLPPEMASYRSGIEKHSIYIPYLLAIEEGQSLEDAVEQSISPNNLLREKITAAIRQSTMKKAVYVKQYSKKSKRYVYYKKWVKTKTNFVPGIYVISFGNKYSLKSVSRVSSVVFNPNRYQNQLYFKNSCLAEKSKEKAL